MVASRDQIGLKSFRSFRRGCACLRNFDEMVGAPDNDGDDGAGGRGFARTRLSAATDTAMRACASSSMRIAIPDKKRDAR